MGCCCCKIKKEEESSTGLQNSVSDSPVLPPFAHLLVIDRNCQVCKRQIPIGAKKCYIHLPLLCGRYHSDLADQVMKNRDLNLSKSIISTSVGGGVLVAGAGRLAAVGKIGAATGKVLGGALGALSVVTGIIEIVDAATEEAPPLPPCKKCDMGELELPGCILVCENCGIVNGESWRSGDKKNHCCQVCESCWDMTTCMKCNKVPATRRLHRKDSQGKIHRELSTHLQGTHKAGRITGSSLSIAGTGALFVPVIGWVVGPVLIASGVTTSIASSASAKPYVTIKCGKCQEERKMEERESFLKNGCETWCMTCGVRSYDTTTCCLVLCDSCEE